MGNIGVLRTEPRPSPPRQEGGAGGGGDAEFEASARPKFCNIGWDMFRSDFGSSYVHPYGPISGSKNPLELDPNNT